MAVLALCLALGAGALARAGTGARATSHDVAGKGGRRGPQGPRGATGPQGPAGAPAEFDVTYRGVDTSLTFTAAPNTASVAMVDCVDGRHVISGGFESVSQSGFGSLSVGSSNAFDSDTWYVEVENRTDRAEGFRVSAVCVPSTVTKRAPGQVRKRGPRGRPGPRGATGPQGPAGSDAVPLSYVSSDFDANGQGSSGAGTPCPKGQIGVGGGMFSHAPFDTQWVVSNHGGPTGWQAQVDTFGPTPRTVTIYAICERSRLADQGAHRTRAADAKRGRRGPRGATGPQGPPGPPGPGNVTLTLRYVTKSFNADPGTQAQGTTECGPGEHVVGGGVFGGPARKTSLNSSRPLGTDAWQAWIDNVTTATPEDFQVTAICASPTTVAGD